MDLFGWVVVALVVGAVGVNIAAAKGKIPGFKGASSLDGLAVKLATLVTKVKGDLAVSYAGRQAIRTIMLFVMVCLDALPDGPEKDKCKQGARDIDAAFFSPPQVTTQEIKSKSSVSI